jgi:hypothetical protein
VGRTNHRVGEDGPDVQHQDEDGERRHGEPPDDRAPAAGGPGPGDDIGSAGPGSGQWAQLVHRRSFGGRDWVSLVVGAVVIAALAAYAWWAVALPPFSGEAAAAVVLAGAVAMVVGARQRPPRRPSGPPAATIPPGIGRWMVLGAVAAAWQLAAYVQQPRADHPTLSSLTNAVLDSRATRMVAVVLWIVVARGLARR